MEEDHVAGETPGVGWKTAFSWPLEASQLVLWSQDQCRLITQIANYSFMSPPPPWPPRPLPHSHAMKNGKTHVEPHHLPKSDTLSFCWLYWDFSYLSLHFFTVSVIPINLSFTDFALSTSLLVMIWHFIWHNRRILCGSLYIQNVWLRILGHPMPNLCTLP